MPDDCFGLDDFRALFAFCEPALIARRFDRTAIGAILILRRAGHFSGVANVVLFIAERVK
jgi:hypothetical protein